MMTEFLESFDYNLETGENYDLAIESIVSFANEAGINLQHEKFSDFSDSMRRRDVFELK